MLNVGLTRKLIAELDKNTDLNCDFPIHYLSTFCIPYMIEKLLKYPIFLVVCVLVNKRV